VANGSDNAGLIAMKSDSKMFDIVSFRYALFGSYIKPCLYIIDGTVILNNSYGEFRPMTDNIPISLQL